MLGGDREESSMILKKDDAVFETPAPRRSSRAVSKRKSLSDEDSDASPTPTPKAAAKSATKRQKTTKMPSSPGHTKSQAQDDEGLFLMVSGSQMALTTIVSDWIDAFEENPTEAMKELVQFVLDSAGCPGKVSSEAIQDPDLVTDALEELQGTTLESDNIEFPLHPARKTKSSIKLKKNFDQFWALWVKQMASADSMFKEDEAGCLDVLSDWLGAMSSCSMRPLRHAGTDATLAIITGLCHVVSGLQTTWTNLTRQMNGEKAKSGSSAKFKSLSVQCDETYKKKMLAENGMSALFDGVFVHRYRDRDPHIRVDCLDALGQWIKALPDVYLDSQYLRYLGWMLSDKDSNVRMQTLKSLLSIYESASLFAGLGAFTERFKKRMFQMAAGEKESSIRHEASKVVGAIATAGLLGESDMEHLQPLLCDVADSVRLAIAPFMAEYIKEELVPTLKDEIAAHEKQHGDKNNEAKARKRKESSDPAKRSNTLAEIKSFVTMVQEAVRRSQEQLTQGSKMTLMSPDDVQHLRELKVARKRALSSVEGLLDTDNDDYVPEIESSHATFLSQDYASLIHEVTRNTLSPQSNTDSEDVEKPQCRVPVQFVQPIVKAMMKHLDCLKNLDVMMEYIVTEEYSVPDEDTGSSPHPLCLSDSELLTLVHILFASSETIHHVSRASSESKALIQEDERLNIQSRMIGFVASLLERVKQVYSEEWISAISLLVRTFDISIYNALNKTDTFEDIVSQLCGFYKHEENPAVLKNLSYALAYMCTGSHFRDDPIAVAHLETTPATKSDLPSSLLRSAEALVVELVESIGSESFLPSLKAASDAANDSSESESFEDLMKATMRLSYLAHVINLHDLSCFQNMEFNGQVFAFDIFNAVVDVALATTRKIQLEKSSENDSFGKETVALSLLMEGVELMLYTCAHELTQCLLKSATMPPQEILVYHDRSSRLVALLEAMLSGEASQMGIVFPIHVQWKTLEQLNVLYVLVNGPLGNRFPEFVCRPSTDIEAAWVDVLDRLVQLFVFVDPQNFPSLPDAVLARNSALWMDPSTDGWINMEFRFYRTFFATQRLISLGLLSPAVSVCLLKYTGLKEDELKSWLSSSLLLEDQDMQAGSDLDPRRPLLPVLKSTIWDTLLSSLFSDVIGDFSNVVDIYTQGNESSERALANAHKMIRNTCLVIRESVSQAIDMYLIGQVPSLDGAKAIAKQVTACMKKWTNTLRQAESTVSKEKAIFRLYFILGRELQVLMAQLGERLVLRYYLHHKLAEDEEEERGRLLLLKDRDGTAPSHRRLSQFTNFTSFRSSFFMDESIQVDDQEESKGDSSKSQSPSLMGFRFHPIHRLHLVPGFDLIPSQKDLMDAWNVIGLLGATIQRIIATLPPLTRAELQKHASSLQEENDGWSNLEEHFEYGSDGLQRTVPLTPQEVVQGYQALFERLELEKDEDETDTWAPFELACKLVIGETVAASDLKRSRGKRVGTTRSGRSTPRATKRGGVSPASSPVSDTDTPKKHVRSTKKSNKSRSNASTPATRTKRTGPEDEENDDVFATPTKVKGRKSAASSKRKRATHDDNQDDEEVMTPSTTSSRRKSARLSSSQRSATRSYSEVSDDDPNEEDEELEPIRESVTPERMSEGEDKYMDSPVLTV